MITVLLGEFCGTKSKAFPYLERHGWGRMWAKTHPQWSYEGEPWGFDNGAWNAYTNGLPFPDERFSTRLVKAIERAKHKPIVAALPDVVGEGMATLALAEHYLNHGWLNMDWPWYLVAQDGMCFERARRLIVRHNLSGVFLGGTDEFKKRYAVQWCKFSHNHGKKFHFARCNRESWIRQAIDIGADSLDTHRPVRALVSGEEDRFRRFEQLVTGQCAQIPLF